MLNPASVAALFSAVVPVSVTVENNHVSNEYWGVFKAGAINVTGLSTNTFSSTVTHPTS